MALFGIKSKAEKERERKKKVMEAVTRQNQPPRTVDKAWRPLDPKRTPYGYRGYDPKKEPMVDIDTRQRASQILQILRLPEPLHLRDVDPCFGKQLLHVVLRMGRCRYLFLFVDRFLVPGFQKHLGSA